MNVFPARVKWVVILAVLVLLAGGSGFYRIQEGQIRRTVENNLQSIAKLKANQIADWRANQLEEGNELTGDTLLCQDFARWLANPQQFGSPEEFLSGLRSLQKHYHYWDILLVDTNGQVRLSLEGNKTGYLEVETLPALSAALRYHQPVLTDLHRDGMVPVPNIHTVAPFFVTEGEIQKPVGAAILVADEHCFLYPLTSVWPTPSQTAEIMIVQRDGSDVVNLNDLRDRPGTALRVRVPLTRTNTLAVLAVLGQEGIVQSVDYRGVKTISAIRHIPDSPWFVVAKMDSPEAFARWRFESLAILGLLGSLLVLAGTIVLVIWQRNQKAHYRALYQAETARLLSEKLYGVTLKSIGDAVITTDVNGRVELLNPIAETLTGWRNEEARGKPLEEIFRIVNETTHQPVENPVGRILREGMVIGLANHTALIARDGTERAIADSGAPIRDEKNKLIGVVLVFREKTEERRMQLALRESEKRFRLLAESSLAGIYLFREGRFLYVNQAMAAIFGYEPEEIIGRLGPLDLVHPDDRSRVTGNIRRRIAGEVEALRFQFRGRRKDGSEIQVEAHGRRIEYEDKPAVLGMLLDITERQRAEATLRESEQQYRQVFENSPVSIWEEDFSEVKNFFDNLKKSGVTDLESYFEQHPEAVRHCAELTKIVDVNQAALALHGAANKDELLAGLVHLFTPESFDTFRHELVYLWKGETEMTGDAVVKTLTGDLRHVTVYFSICPGYEQTLSKVLVSLVDITERKQAEAALHRLNRELRAITNCNQILVRAEDENKLLQDVCNVVCQEAGYLMAWVGYAEPDEAKTIHPVVWAGAENGYLKNLQISWADTERGRGPTGTAIRTGQTVYIQDFATDPRVTAWRDEALKRGFHSSVALPLKDEKAKTFGALMMYSAEPNAFTPKEVALLEELAGDLAFGINVLHIRNERKQMEEKLKESQGRLKAVFDSAADGILVADLKDKKFLMCNSAICQMLGYGRDEMLSLGVMDIHPQEDLPYVLAQFEKQVRKERELAKNIPLKRKDGSVFYADVNSFHLTLEGRECLAGFFRDITDRRRTEEALRESEDKLTRAQAMAHVGHWSRDLIANTVEWSDENFRIFGLTPQAGPVDARIFFETIHPEDRERVRRSNEDALAGLKEHDIDYRIVRPDGTIRFLHAIGEVFRDSSGKPLRLFGCTVDITERKLAEKRIREQAALLDAASDAIYVRTLDHTITYWNDGAERLYGLSRAEALGHKITDLLGPLGREAFEVAQTTLLAQGHWSGELKLVNKAGKERVVFCRWTMLRDEKGNPTEILAINTDITERKQLEANFLRAQRMEGIGALAGGIAHDLNNILQPILITAPLLRETISDPESRSLLDTMENSAQRGADIIKQLLTFARGTPDVRVPLPVRHLMNDMDKIIRETFPRNIKLKVDAPKDLWPVLGDATQIHQVLMNLCVNARDAMPNGGMLTLTAKNLTLDETFTAVMADAQPGTYICVSVSDTGTGIPPEHLDRIFDPFFTTKEIGKGTGLGLATVLGIVRGHGGFIRVNSHVGRGTAFELYLPATPKEKAIEKSDREILPPEMHGELVLVVDDEAPVRNVIQRTLEKHGYRVATAAEGSEAMAFFAQHRAEVKAVVTDLMMPGMDGAALIRALRHLEPRLPILSMTGIGEQADIKGIQGLGLPVLLKPFVRAELLATLHRIIAAAEPGPAAK
jgi:PAS domain S-box-containing protein